MVSLLNKRRKKSKLKIPRGEKTLTVSVTEKRKVTYTWKGNREFSFLNKGAEGRGGRRKPYLLYTCEKKKGGEYEKQGFHQE